VLDELMMLICF